MNRSQLIREFREATGLSATEADWFVRRFFEVIGDGLKRDGRVELRGFGVLRLSTRNQAGFLNPKDGRYYGGLTIRTIKFSETQAEGPDAR
ncbi:MAG: HU family DNA-binding protein [Acidobacteriota bacterium]|nr:HU family DNA-binding protein [Acidobacteriota bacterium]